MAYVDFKKGFVRFKIVYYGPDFSGKTSNLEHLGRRSKDVSEMRRLGAEDGQTGLFEHLPVNLGRLRGIETLLNLYTAPGDVKYNKTRQLVLKDVDGIVFVVDSQNERMDSNIASMQDLEENLARLRVKLSDLSVIIQYNKRDLTDVLPIKKLEANLNLYGWPYIEASALSGQNVKKTLTMIAQLVYKQAATEYALVPSGVPAAPRSATVPEPAPQKERAEEGKEEGEQTITEMIAAQESKITEQPGEPAPSQGVLEQPPRADSGGQPIPAGTARKSIEAELADELFELGDDDLEMFDHEEGPSSRPTDDLSRNVAAHLIKTVPPPPALRPSSVPAKGETSLGVVRDERLEMVGLISTLEERLFTRISELETGLNKLADRGPERMISNSTETELMLTMEEIREIVGDLSQDFRNFEKEMSAFRETVENLLKNLSVAKISPPRRGSKPPKPISR